MYVCVKSIPCWGRVLWLSNEAVEVGVALDFGIRVVHLSCAGCENLFYTQPADLSDGFKSDNGWRLYGGHRLWMSPESDDSYSPDNSPVSWEKTSKGVRIIQDIDPVLQIRKSICISFPEDGCVRLEQSIQNVSDHPLDGASWGVNTLDAGGKAIISFVNGNKRNYLPNRIVSLWSDTNLHDPRLSFDKFSLTARHIPLQDYLKIGLYCVDGKAVFENKGQRLTLLFDSAPLTAYPDNGCNFELYMCKSFMELETLGTRTHLLPGESTRHTETWVLSKI